MTMAQKQESEHSKGIRYGSVTFIDKDKNDPLSTTTRGGTRPTKSMDGNSFASESDFLPNHKKSPKGREKKWYHDVADFANLLKSFIGTNYLSLAFGIRQAGIGLGIAGLVLVAALTAHCCHLIVKVKYHAIRAVMSKRRAMGSSSPRHHSAEEQLMYRRLQRTMTYSDIGRVAFGKWGGRFVNIFLVITQVGFCMTYHIFIGSNIYSLISSANQEALNSTTQPATAAVQQLGVLRGGLEKVPGLLYHQNHMSNSHLLKAISPSGAVHINSPVIKLENETSSLSPISNISTQPTTPVGPTSNISTQPTTPVGPTSNISTQPTTPVGPTSNISTQPTTPVGPTSNISTQPTTPVGPTSSISTQPTTPVGPTTTEAPPTPTYHSSTYMWLPPLALLVILPLPLFIAFTLFRDVRIMGFVSLLANGTMSAGYFAVVAYIIANFTLADDLVWFKWATFPVFLGQAASSYEAIGTILSIESSMDGNHHRYPTCLYSVVGVFSSMLMLSAILGYLKYGEQTAQILVQNLPQTGALIIVVNVALITAVLLTYPLQVYPVIEIIEGALFSEGAVFGPARAKSSSKSSATSLVYDETQPLIESQNDAENAPETYIGKEVPDSVATWKRNTFRVCVAVFIGGLAVAFKDVFAYVSAFVGALGSCPLAFILPCLFHIKLCRPHLSRGVFIKDIVVIVIGSIVAVVSLVVVILKVVYEIRAP